MKRQKLTLAGGSLLALIVAVAPAAADSLTYTGAEQTFTAPVTGVYDIVAYGAQGGASTIGAFPTIGGLGAEIGGEFTLTAGEVLDIYVGGAGASSTFDAGGGGGSFVVGPGDIALVVAGGGGGSFPGQSGQGGQTTASSSNGGPGGGEAGGGGGGGFTTNGVSGGSDGSGGAGGLAFPTLTGGAGDTFSNDGAGGFGGGGGAGVAGGGGGGGYSGGNGGYIGSGGGGGSFDSGLEQVLDEGENSGDGSVVISEVPTSAPEPGSIALLGFGLIGVGCMGRRTRQSASKPEKRNI